MNSFTLDIRTPEASLFLGRVASLTVPAQDGELGVLPGHAPLATILATGKIKYQRENGERCQLDGQGGFLVVQNDQASLRLQPTV
jgi:F-type H+-transporting ATPase subunit epsilon